VQEVLQQYKALKDIIAILGMTNCRKTTSCGGARPQDHASCPAFFVAEQFTNSPASSSNWPTPHAAHGDCGW